MITSILAYGRRHHLALLALFVALGGTAYAAVQLPANSVGSKQLKANAVKASETAKNSVASAEVKNRALLCADFKPGQGLCGARVFVRSKTVTFAQTCQDSGMGRNCVSPRTTVTASCAPGERAVGGGYEGTKEGTFNPPYRQTFVEGVDRPEPSNGTPRGWTVVAGGSATSTTTADPFAPVFTVYAVCVS